MGQFRDHLIFKKKKVYGISFLISVTNLQVYCKFQNSINQFLKIKRKILNL